MYYSEKDTEQPYSTLVSDFGGLNTQYSISENEWADMENLSTRRYPLACPRERRTLLKEWGKIKVNYPDSYVDYVDINKEAVRTAYTDSKGNAPTGKDLVYKCVLGSGYERINIFEEIKSGKNVAVSTTEPTKKTIGKKLSSIKVNDNDIEPDKMEDGSTDIPFYKGGTYWAKIDKYGDLIGVYRWMRHFIRKWEYVDEAWWATTYTNQVSLGTLMPNNEPDPSLTVGYQAWDLNTNTVYYNVYLLYRRMMIAYPGTSSKKGDAYDKSQKVVFFCGKHPENYTLEDFDGWGDDVYSQPGITITTAQKVARMQSPKAGDIWIDYKYTDLNEDNAKITAGRKPWCGIYQFIIQGVYKYDNGAWTSADRYTINKLPTIWTALNETTLKETDFYDNIGEYEGNVSAMLSYNIYDADDPKIEYKENTATYVSEGSAKYRAVCEDLDYTIGRSFTEKVANKIYIKKTPVLPYALYKQSVNTGTDGCNWKELPTKFYSQVFKNDKTKYVSRNIPTAFKCCGAWVTAYTNYTGKTRISIANNEIDPDWSAYTAGQIDGYDSSASLEGTLTGDDTAISSYVYNVEQDAKTRRNIVPMGAKIVLFPEKYYVNLYDQEDKGNLENISKPLYEDAVTGNAITITPCTLEGEEYSVKAGTTEKPSDPKNGQVWIDTSDGTPQYKIYDESTKMWNTVATTYLKISCEGAFKGFSQYDSISISGFSYMSVTGVNGQNFETYIDAYDDAQSTIYSSETIERQANKFFKATETVFQKLYETACAEKGNVNTATYDLESCDGINDYVKRMKHYQKLYCRGLGGGFKDGNAVYDDSSIISQIDGLNQDGVIIYRCTDDYIIIAGLIDAVLQFQPINFYKDDGTLYKSYGKYTFARTVPDLDYYCESNNRIWGCKFGLNDDGDVVNEIYACKLGDPKNWQAYLGVSTDSYTLSVGSDGEWTGCINFQGYPTFFKQKYIYQIYGTYPASYQLIQKNAKGVGKGLSDSLIVVGSYCYYATSDGFCLFDGSQVYSISSALGKMDIQDCFAGTDMKKIYWVVTDSNSNKTLYVYDTDTQLWMKESCGDIMFFANDAHVLLAIKKIYDNNLKCYRYQTWSMTEDYNTIWYDDNWTKYEHSEDVYPEYEDPVEWWAETGDIGFADVSGKYIQKIQVRAKVAEGAYYNVEISYDGGDYMPITATNYAEGIRKRDYIFRINRCDYFRLRFSGKGDVTLLTIYKSYLQGSDKA